MNTYLQNNVEYLLLDENVAAVKSVTGFAEKVIIPSHIKVDENVYSVKSVAPNAFRGSAVKEVIMAEGIMAVGDGAFAKSSIQKVQFPATLSEAGSLLFDECGSLRQIVCGAKCPPESDMLGFFSKSEVEMVVPVGSSKMYMADDNWGELGTFSEADIDLVVDEEKEDVDLYKLIADLTRRVSELERKVSELENRK